MRREEEEEDRERFDDGQKMISLHPLHLSHSLMLSAPAEREG